jgi:hypothetical protein
MEGAAPPLASTVVTEENGNIVLSEIRIVTVDEKKDKGLANWPATGAQVLAIPFWTGFRPSDLSNLGVGADASWVSQSGCRALVERPVLILL